jgi:hypothetical protein
MHEKPGVYPHNTVSIAQHRKTPQFRDFYTLPNTLPNTPPNKNEPETNISGSPIFNA